MSTQPRSAPSPSDAAIPFHVPERVGRVPGKREVFRAMIEWEAISGSLTPARRKRLVRYAAQLGLSATQAGELIRACLDRPRGAPNLPPTARDFPEDASDDRQAESQNPQPTLRYVPAPTTTSHATRAWSWPRLAPFCLASLAIAALLALRLLR